MKSKIHFIVISKPKNHIEVYKNDYILYQCYIIVMKWFTEKQTGCSNVFYRDILIKICNLEKCLDISDRLIFCKLLLNQDFLIHRSYK